MPHILICNDDGVMAPGIWHLANTLSSYADITVVAPLTEQSATGMGITIHQPLHINKFKWSCGREVFGVNGKPADCVKLSMHTLFKENQPDMVVSGINRGNNMGRNVFYSGTVAAVVEASMKGIPGIAFSCCNHTEPDYETACEYIPEIVEYFFRNPLPPSTIMNVNFPDCESQDIKGLRLARQGKQYCSENPDKRLHPVGKQDYYWLGLQITTFDDESHNSDVALLQDNYITAVPLLIDQWTHNSYLEEQESAFNAFFSDSTLSPA